MTFDSLLQIPYVLEHIYAQQSPLSHRAISAAF